MCLVYGGRVNSKAWDNPEELIWLAGGFGDKQVGYSANGSCKIRAAARLGMDTLDIKLNQPDSFIDIVDKQSDKSANQLVFGDFPHGGAVFLEMGGVRLLVAVSCLEEDEDGVFGLMVGGAAIQALHRSNQLHLIAT